MAVSVTAARVDAVPTVVARFGSEARPDRPAAAGRAAGATPAGALDGGRVGLGTSAPSGPSLARTRSP